MDSSSLARLRDLKNQNIPTTKEQSQPALDPSIFFTQVPGTKVQEVSTVEDDLFGGKSSISSNLEVDNADSYEADIFGDSNEVQINQSFNLEEQAQAEASIIHDLEDQLKQTKLSDPKSKIIEENKSQTAYSNGSISYEPESKDSSSKKLKSTRKSVKVSEHSKDELEGVDAYELVLIKLFLQKIKK
jgi:hypothetical protein